MKMERKKRIRESTEEVYNLSLNLYSYIPDYIIYKKTDVNRAGLAAGRVISFEENTIKDGERKLVIDLYKRKKERRIISSKMEKEDRQMF